MNIPDWHISIIFAGTIAIFVYNLLRCLPLVRAAAAAGAGSRRRHRFLRIVAIANGAMAFDAIFSFFASALYSNPPIPGLREILVDSGLWFIEKELVLIAILIVSREFWQTFDRPALGDESSEADPGAAGDPGAGAGAGSEAKTKEGVQHAE